MIHRAELNMHASTMHPATMSPPSQSIEIQRLQTQGSRPVWMNFAVAAGMEHFAIIQFMSYWGFVFVISSHTLPHCHKYPVGHIGFCLLAVFIVGPVKPIPLMDQESLIQVLVIFKFSQYFYLFKQSRIIMIQSL